MSKNTKKLKPEENFEDTKQTQSTFSDSTNEVQSSVDDSEVYQEGVELCCILPKNLTEELKVNPKEIYETNELRILTNQMFCHLASSATEYCFLSGDFSVGKTTVVENIVQKINSKEAPSFFWEHQILQFDSRDFLSLENEIFLNSIAVAIAELYSEDIHNIIIYVKHIKFLPQEILNLLHRFYNTMMNSYEGLELRFIFSVHYTFWENVPNYPFLTRSVIKTVTVPKFEELTKILLPRVRELEKIHGCTISEELLNFLVTLVMSNGSDSPNPKIKTYIFFIDLILTKVELAERDEVTLQDIYKNFEKSFNDWNSFSEKERARIAYHESGHTVLGLVALSEYYQLMAVTGIPSMEFSSLGATIEHFKTHLYNVDKKLLKKFVAFYLAGREAEVLAGYKRNNGAKSDIKQSSDMLVDTISLTGLFKEVSQNYSYDLEHFVSSEAVLKIEKAAQKFANKSAKYARKILDENWKLVEMIANRLITDGLLSGVEVEKIYKSYLKKNKKKKK